MRNIVHNKMRMDDWSDIRAIINNFYAVREEADAWLLQNLEKDSYKSYSTFWEFASEEDALIFKLRFGL